MKAWHSVTYCDPAAPVAHLFIVVQKTVGYVSESELCLEYDGTYVLY